RHDHGRHEGALRQEHPAQALRPGRGHRQRGRLPRLRRRLVHQRRDDLRRRRALQFGDL
ncbi:MAG: 3-oxoacyl-[acyl-carrier protein] reductase, partial [uncultured Rubrobacteraceae bacterium]